MSEHVSMEQWARVFKAMVETVASLNLCILRTRQVPRLYESGVCYQRSPSDEAFSAIPIVLRRGWGTVADLVAWRIAEILLDAQQGDVEATADLPAAKAYVAWKMVTAKHWQYTFQVRHADGHLEDVVAEIERLQRDPGWMNRASLQELERMGFVRQATEEEIQAQRASWAHGEALMGSDADEARERQALREKIGARS